MQLREPGVGGRFVDSETSTRMPGSGVVAPGRATLDGAAEDPAVELSCEAEALGCGLESAAAPGSSSPVALTIRGTSW